MKPRVKGEWFRGPGGDKRGERSLGVGGMEEEAEVPELDEALGQDVLEETAHVLKSQYSRTSSSLISSRALQQKFCSCRRPRR